MALKPHAKSPQLNPALVYWSSPCSMTMTLSLPRCGLERVATCSKMRIKMNWCGPSSPWIEAIFSPTIAKRMMQYFTASPARQSISKKPDEFSELTEREHEILDLIAQGHKNTVIANKLSLSIKTVQNYVSSILTKLQLADRSQAIVRAREAGLGNKG